MSQRSSIRQNSGLLKHPVQAVYSYPLHCNLFDAGLDSEAAMVALGQLFLSWPRQHDALFRFFPRFVNVCPARGYVARIVSVALCHSHRHQSRRSPPLLPTPI